MFEGPDNQALVWPLCLTGSNSPQLLMWAGFRGYQLLREAEKLVWSCFQLPFHISIRPLAGRPSWLMLHCRSLMFFSLRVPRQRCSISLSHRAALHVCSTAQLSQWHPCAFVHHIAAPSLHGGGFNCLTVDQVTFLNFFSSSFPPSLNISEPSIEMRGMF